LAAKEKFLVDRISPEWLKWLVYHMVSGKFYEISKLVENALLEGVKFGKRKDVFNRLVDLDLCLKQGQTLSWTDKGIEWKEACLSDESNVLEYIHLLHYAYGELPGKRPYFFTYRSIINLFYEHPLLTRKDALTEVLNLLDERFPAFRGQFGVTLPMIGKALVFWKEIIGTPEVQLRNTVRPHIMAYAISLLYQARGLKLEDPLLLTESRVSEICHYLLLNKETFEDNLDRMLSATNLIQEQFTTSGRSLILKAWIAMK
jgi:hypothetical protein